MARARCADADMLSIHLSTSNDDEHAPDSIDIFDELQEHLAAHGIEFTYDMKATHDRFIETDNGWIITLGRGLDIFEPFGRFSIDRINQKERRCREFSISYSKEKIG